ncbi:O-antigen ligase family protein [Patescibacteria group bacterium]|nr:O-antigen ligase family protein [Patescibacteria group bacterium]MBU1016084.1 O-antigen ligase family protein [Patescibacteria group bacterium]MBU1684827.1 O-antigen ligase family protein [Patescibacteria group bacterium]MBU1938543.1 O-antigen ligase family protein [Patescibacteria group bacterium]
MKSSSIKSWEKLLLLLAYASPFVFPLYLVRFSVYGIPFTVLESFCYLFFAVFLLAVLLKTRKIRWERPARWYYLSAFVLFLGATLGVITAPHYIALPSGVLMDSQQAALGVWKGWVVAPMLFFFVFTQVVDSGDKLKKLLLNFIYSGALVALLAYVWGIVDAGFTYDFRLSGFFESANYLSLYLGPPLLLGVYYLLQENFLRRREEFYSLVSVTVMAHALFLTQSYAAIIGVFGALGLYILVLLVRYKFGMKKLVAGLAGLVILLLAIMISQWNSPKFQQFMDFENRSSSTVRLEIYEVASGLISDYPLTGVGPGLFQGYYQTKGPDILGKAPMEWNIPHPHNIFLAFWLNAGIPGLLALLAFLILAHVRLTYPVIALWGIVIHGLFDTPFWKNDLSMIFWFVIGAILILQTYGSSAPKKPAAPIRKRAGIRRSSSARARKLKA